MEPKTPTTWETYEQVARYLLDMLAEEFGLERVEGKQPLNGKSGTKWTIDAKGVIAESGAIVVVECRRRSTSKLNQESMGALAYRISDLGAERGIVVTPIGVQSGGEIVAKHEGIEIVRLNADATRTDFVIEFLEKVVNGASAHLHATGTLTAEAEVVRADNPKL
jgi:hypothetical protein